MWHHRTVTRRRGGYLPGGWRTGEVWLDPGDVLWFGELKRTLAEAVPLQPLAVVAGVGTVAEPAPAFRPRPTSRKRRLTTRLAPTVAALTAAGLGVPLVVASRAPEATFTAQVAAPVAAGPHDRPAESVLPAWIPAPPPTAESPPVEPARVAESPPETGFPAIRWRDSTAVGVPHAGALVDGVRLPQRGPGWATWDPVLDRVPNRPGRLFGTDAVVRVTLEVIAAYRLAHPHAPPVLVGDISRRVGGELDLHVSHENGLDIDVYYPRRDGRLRPPRHAGHVDVPLAQDLIDRFVSAGAHMIFVGSSGTFTGPSGIVVPYPNHDDHLHVRFAPGSAGE